MNEATDIRVHRLSAALGAEVEGVDLSEEISDAVSDRLHGLLMEHEVIFLRGQRITPAQHSALAARFGTHMCHPAYPTVEGFPEVTILHHTRERPSKIEKWHHDMTFRPRPPLGSVLYARELPEVGGDTMWASMSAAWQGLSDPMQRFVDDLVAEHSFAWGFKESLAEPGGRERLADAVAANPPVQHPVVRTHPVSRKRGLFVNELFTTRILGLSERESQAVLAMLCEHATQPEYTCRFRWSVDAIAIWDNRITQHKPINDYWPAERRMHRVVIEGGQPR